MSEALVDSRPLEALLSLGVRVGEHRLLVAATGTLAGLLGERGSAILTDGADARVVHATHAPMLRDWAIDLTRYPEIRAALSERRVVAISDAHGDERLAGVRTLLPSNLRSVVVVPMCVDERGLGVLMLQSSRPCTLQDAQLRTAELVGRMTAVLLDSIRMRSRLEGKSKDSGSFPALTDPTTLLHSKGRDPASVPSSEAVKRLLLIDDDEDYSSTVKMVLEEEGYLVDVAASRADGLQRAREQPPRVVLMDVNLPGGDGFALADTLIEDPLTREIPVLFLSGADDLLMRVRRRPSGDVDFLAKPFTTDELLARVDRLVSHHDLRERLKEAANVDELTGLNNLRFLRDRLAIEEARWQRYNTPVTIVMIDMDRLKAINDRFGHLIGSQSIAALGKLLREGTRETDIAVRYGGDEFVVVMPHATMDEGMAFAERTLVRLKEIRVGDGHRLSASLGVATTVGSDAIDLETLLQRADSAAYESKRKGGGCATAYSEQSPIKSPS